MHTALGLSGRHTLHTVHARLIFHRAIHIVASNAHHDFLISARGSLATARHSYRPSLRLAILGIHLEKVSGKYGSFVTACSATNLKHHILRILRVSRHKQELNLLLKRGQSIRSLVKLILGHLTQLGV